MKLRMRADIKEARNTLKEVMKRMGLGQEVYNLAIKAYLKGYYQALRNVQNDEIVGK